LLIGSEFEEVPGPHHGGGLRRELFKLYRGRFCFPLGIGLRCAGGGTSFSIAAGETRSLELSAQIGLGGSLPAGIGASGTLGANRKIEYTHTFSQDIGPWTLGDCDSMFPALCFDNAELRLFRWRRALRRYELAGLVDEFDPRGPGWATPNKLENDPLCDCHESDKPSKVETSKVPTDGAFSAIAIIRPLAFLPLSDSSGERDDPIIAVDEAVEIFADILTPEDAPSSVITAFARSDGVIIWLDSGNIDAGPTLGLFPWGLGSVVRGQLTLDTDIVPLLAIGRPTEAVSCDLTILIQAPGSEELQEVVSDAATLRVTERMTIAWYEADFRNVERGSTGFIDMQLRDASGAQVGYPLRESFAVEQLESVRTLAHA
jgi:hypothetical protein